MDNARIVFAGTPEFAAPCLRALLQSRLRICAVYTQPDRPAGRGRKLTASPIKDLALEAGIAVEQPQSLRDPQAVQRLRTYRPDLIVVVAYGLLLPADVLELPALGCVNVHASLLPRWRGAAPIQHAILAGDEETGITLMQMDAGLDTGPILASARCEITAAQTAGELHDRLSELGAHLLSERLTDILAGAIRARAQHHEAATYAGKITKEDAELGWRNSARSLERAVRAYNPWPVAHTRFDQQTMRVWRALAVDASDGAPPGTVLDHTADGIDVATGSGVLRLLEVQLPGRRRITAADLANTRVLTGVRLGAEAMRG